MDSTSKHANPIELLENYRSDTQTIAILQRALHSFPRASANEAIKSKEGFIMNERLTYHREGDYLLPNVVPPKDPQIGVWGLRRKNYLLNSKKPLYTGMLLSGKLNAHLEEIDHTASEMLDQLMGDMAKREGVTEALKASDQMAWVGAMNNIRNRAEEIVLREVVFA